MCDENNTNCCLADLLKKIVKLQKVDNNCCNEQGCEKPFLGPTLSTICYNTRPVSFYNCTTGELWAINYTTDEGTTATSTVFRVENVDDCCCTCRILIETGTAHDITYTPTNEFFTIDLGCVSAVQCHNDTYIDIC